MKSSRFVCVAAIFLAQFVHGAVTFDPHGISVTKSTWSLASGEFKGEYYHDYLYGDEVMFRVLGRYTPILSCLIQEAKSTGGRLKLCDSSIIFFCSKEKIKENFCVALQPPSPSDNVAVIDPQSLKLHVTTGAFGGKNYFIECADDPDGLEIKKPAFDALSLQKELAQKNGYSLCINFSRLAKNDACAAQCVSLQPIVTNELQCVICKERAKEILQEPCNHICVCEACSKKMQETCPICRQKIVSKRKIYL